MDKLRIIELEGQVERKDAYIDKLTGELEELRRQNAQWFGLNEQLKRQVNDKQLEIQHCHACCDELRGKMTAAVADALDKEADLILAAPAIGDGWTEIENKLALKIGTMMKTRAALVRAGGM